MQIQEVIEKVLLNQTELLIKCTDEKNRNVLRTTGFRARKKLRTHPAFKNLANSVGFTNEEHNGALFLKVYYKQPLTTYKFDSDGKLVKIKPAETKYQEPNEATIMLKRLVQDQKPEAEIIALMRSAFGWPEAKCLERIKDEQNRLRFLNQTGRKQTRVDI